jgi:energy-coupling factor transporter ATP-binding protein EcfA2
MINKPAGGVFGHRNARSKSPHEVAEGFVAPPQYWEIAQPGNTVISGPRGSGKTTLLKMLQGAALEHWEDSDAKRARELVTYSGVLIPADQSWSGQVRAYQQMDDRLRTSLGDTCYTLHALRALSRCAGERVSPGGSTHPHGRVELERGQEERIVGETWRGWGLREPAGSFSGLTEAMSSLISEIGRLALRAWRLESIQPLIEHPALDLDLVDAAIPFIERFNNAVNQPDHVWALLIDEIEFLPQGIHTSIMRSMRGRDPRLIRKVSIAPYTLVAKKATESPFAAWEGHDLEVVDLTFRDKEDGYPFSRALIRKEIEALNLNLSPAGLLGEPGFFEDQSQKRKDAYAKGSRNAVAIANLARADPSFKQWLDQHGIDPANPAKTTGVQRAATLRKAMPIILLRHAYLHSVRGKLQNRSRKIPHTYVGELSAYAICENNPRLLQTLASRLLRTAVQKKNDDGRRAEAVDGIARQFALYLRAIEVPKPAPNALLPAQMIDTIGEYFKKRIYGREFNSEPPLSFDAPGNSLDDPVLQQILSQMVFYGAIIPVGENRFRLAHTFAPIYRLPLRAGRPLSLQSIFGSAFELPEEQMRISHTDDEALSQ